jgi:hypothetical protein
MLEHYERTGAAPTPRELAAAAEQLAANLTRPVLVDAERRLLVAGAAVVDAARRASRPAVPVVRLDQVGPAQREAFLGAEARLATLEPRRATLWPPPSLPPAPRRRGAR